MGLLQTASLNLSTILLVVISIIFVVYYIRNRWWRSQSNLREFQTIASLQERNKAFAATAALNTIILQTLNFDLLAQRIANAIPQFLGYQTGVLAIVDEHRGVLKRVAISETSGGVAALQSLEIPFRNIDINLSDTNNFCIRALRENKKMVTNQLFDVLRPVISKENSDVVQKTMGTKTTLVYPIYSQDNKPLGTFLVSMDKEEKDISEYEYQTISNFVDGVKIALGNARLFTSLIKTTEQLQEANEKLRELDQLKDDFVSIASHELRTPMTAIKSYLWMALNRGDMKLSERMKRYLDRAYISTERLINLVNDMLNVSRIEAGRVEISPLPFDPIKLAQEVVEDILPKALEKGIEIEVIQKQVPKVFADPDKVHQILLNLLGNSLKFTPAGGMIKIDFFSDGKVVEVLVKDNGVGIAKEDLSRLFQKFGKLDNSYIAAAANGGTGLGLYICKSLVELMKGRIWATSEGLGKGSTFIFSLPVATSSVIGQAEKYTHTPIGEGKHLEPVAV